MVLKYSRLVYNSGVIHFSFLSDSQRYVSSVFSSTIDDFVCVWRWSMWVCVFCHIWQSSTIFCSNLEKCMPAVSHCKTFCLPRISECLFYHKTSETCLLLQKRSQSNKHKIIVNLYLLVDIFSMVCYLPCLGRDMRFFWNTWTCVL